MKPAVVAIIVTYNRLAQLQQTWLDTAAQGYTEIIVVNNNSTDETEQWLESLRDLRLTVLHSGRNLGGAGGFKYALNWLALERKGTYSDNNVWLVLYDDDASPCGNVLEVLDKACLQFPQADLFAASVVNEQGCSLTMNEVLLRVPESFADQFRLPLQRSNFVAKPISGPVLAEASSFVGCFIRYEVACQQRDFLEEKLFLYFDDVLFTHRLVRTGFSLVYYPDLQFIHRVSVENRGIYPPWKLYFYARNMWQLYRLYSPRWFWISVLMRLFKAAFDILRNKSQAGYNLKLLVKGAIDGFNNDYDKNISDVVNGKSK